MRPTELGTIVNNLLVEYLDVVDIGFTAQIEEHLDQVAEGRGLGAGGEGVLRPLRGDGEGASMMERVEIADEPSDEVCDVCGRPMVIKLGRSASSSPSGFPECATRAPC